MSRGLARSGFDIDLRDGQASETSLSAILKHPTIEVKSDKLCRKTGNVFIEYRHKGRPSCIAVTTAQYYAIEFTDKSWLLIPTPRLKAIARQYYRKHRWVRGGDYDSTEGVLVPLHALLQA